MEDGFKVKLAISVLDERSGELTTSVAWFDSDDDETSIPFGLESRLIKACAGDRMLLDDGRVRCDVQERIDTDGLHQWCLDAQLFSSPKKLAEHLATEFELDSTYGGLADLERILSSLPDGLTIVWRDHDKSLRDFGLSFTEVLKVFKGHARRIVLKLR